MGDDKIAIDDLNLRCTLCVNCVFCIDCIDCVLCKDCLMCVRCEKCVDCYECVDCVDCRNCILCQGLKCKVQRNEYFLRNRKVSEEEFEKAKKELGYDVRDGQAG